MKIEFKRNALLQSLKIVDKFTAICKSRKEYENLKIEAQDNNIVLQIGSDLGFMHLTLEGTILENGLACFNALDFIHIVAGLQGPTIHVDCTENKIILRDANSKIRLGSVDSNSFIARTTIANQLLGWMSIDSKDLSKIANTCIPFEDEPQIIPGINIRSRTDNTLQFGCCSNAAMGLCTLTPRAIHLDVPLDITLPTQSLKNLCDIVKGEEIKVEFFDTVIRISLASGFIILKTLGKAYPKIEKLISSSFKYKLPIKVAELSHALNLIDIIAYNGSVLLEYNSQGCIVSNEAGFNTNISLKSEIDEDITLKLERRLLKRVLGLFASQDTLMFLYNEYKKPVTIREDNRLIMLSVLEQR